MFYLKHIFRLRETLQVVPEDEEKPFLDHLDDLRKVILRIVLTLLIVMFVCFPCAPLMMNALREPVDRVWERYEASHLPAGVPVDDWEKAKSLAAVLPSLDAPARDLLLARENPEVRELWPLVPVLKAALILPEKERMDFVSQATAPHVTDRALALLDAGAVLQEGKGRDSLRLMSAFQPGEGFMLSIKMAFFGGIVISFPLLMYFLLQFIVPGLLVNERRLLYKSVAYGFLLFLAGCLFAYFAVLPRVLTFFYEYSLNLGIENDWRIGYYISFAVKLVFMFGVTFELPVLVVPLVKLGILTYDLMTRTRAYAIAAILILSLILAPAPDPGTLLIMAVPMYLLYELCIWFAWLDRRKRLREEAETL